LGAFVVFFVGFFSLLEDDESLSEELSSLSLTFAFPDFVEGAVNFTGFEFSDFLTIFVALGFSSEEDESEEEDFLAVYFLGELLELEELLELIID